ncbi:hypothetical protein [Roseovarius mucosus]|uniref:hypothetical protein n=1 Tax=Roseovarius mucosus TaxID=215743 RepID=UPI003BAC1B3D
MLDDDLHMTLPEAEVTAFFKAELRRVMRDLRIERTIEHVDGSMTTGKARQNHLNAIILSGMAEDGLRKEMPQARLAAISPVLRDEAAQLHRKAYAECMSDSFNEGIQLRAADLLDRSTFTEYDKLFLRKAAIEARMAAYTALETVPIHASDQARAAALDLLTGHQAASAPDIPLPPPSLPEVGTTAPAPQQCLTDGVELIRGRFTAQTIHHQRDQAMRQPEEPTFDGISENVVVDRIRGADLFGTAVRMIRKSKSQEDTCLQKLKSVSLFIYLTGVQMVTDIRQHHLEMFSHGLEKQLPTHYWKSDAQKNRTFKELAESVQNRTDIAVGLSPPTIARHLTTIVSIIQFAANEGNTVPFTPKTTNLVPLDKRSDAEKRAVFTFEDVQRVFMHPLWQGGKSKGRRHTPGSLIIKDHHYWINLLLVYTGARRSEIAGLRESDVGFDGVIPFVHIRENTVRGLKTRFSKRRVPLHPHLIELGLMDFVADKRATGDLFLFPEAIPAKIRALCLQVDGPIPPYDKKFGDSLDHVWRECLMRSLDGNPEEYCAASLRSYVNDTLINLRKEDGSTLVVPGIDRRDLMGHKPQDVNEGNYRRDEKPLGPLYVAIKQLPRLFSAIE